MALVTLAAMLLATGNAATGSRTGLVQLPLLLLLAAIWRARLPASVWRVLAVGVVAYLLASFLLPRLLGLDPPRAASPRVSATRRRRAPAGC